MNKDTRVLILGGGGYIGRALVDEMISHGVPIDNFTLYDAFMFDPPPRHFNYQIADIRDTNKLYKEIDSHDVIVNLAAYVGDAACSLYPAATLHINRDCIKRVRDRANGKKIITISSASVYGTNENIVNEESPVNPLSIYAYSKVGLEEVLAGTNSFVARFGTVFGISKRCRLRLDLVLNILTANAYFNGKIKVSGGKQYRPLIHVEDVADVLYKQIYDYPKINGIYNISYDNISIDDLSKIILKYLPDTEVEYTNISFEDARNYQCSTEKAKKDFGFNPQYNFDFGILELIMLFDTGSIDINNPFYRNDKWMKLHPELLKYHKNYSNYDEELKSIKLSSVVK